MSIIMLDPTEQPELRVNRMAPRPESPLGLRLALLANGKPNGDRLLEDVAALLHERYETAVVRLIDKRNAGRPASGDILADLLKDVDAALTAIGD